MVKSEYRVIGVMSGTSLDGIDLCDVHFSFNGYWAFKIINAETIDYAYEWTELLKNSVSLNKKERNHLDKLYTNYLNGVIKKFIKKYNIDGLDAICSHGHTVLHQPENGITHQIGNLQSIAEGFECPVVCDFRVDDVKLGGQGAPLVPIGDHFLFNEYESCLNLGGFANISLESKGIRIAYDICPVNIVLNHYANQLGYFFDENGSIAKSGAIHYPLLERLNALSFYNILPPKSLGIEWVKEFIFSLINSIELSHKDILRTFVEHIAIQISREINNIECGTVLVTGGGAFNAFLIDRISSKTKNNIIIPENSIVNYKEALIFGLLGVLKLRNEINCLSSVTGAQKSHSSGKVY